MAGKFEQFKRQQEEPKVVFYNLDCFEKYSNFELVNETELNYAINYICGNLNSCYSLNYPYWYNMYCYTTKNLIVLRKKEEVGKVALTKLGECVCQNKVINFLENEENKCFCSNRCSSVYFKVVF